uniref:Integrase catalytic domain-containing protein n=1 Tax=Trichogramma kaykai TaxID=54128 RepID=A0ABD2WMT1_9HYME
MNALFPRLIKVQMPHSEIHPPLNDKHTALVLESLENWHQKFVHQNWNRVKEVLKSFNLKFENSKDFFCGACALGKAHRLPFTKSVSKTSYIGELVHADVCGPMQTKSMNGSRFFLLLKDDYLHFRSVYFLNLKSDAKRCIKDFVLKSEKHCPNGIKTIRTDNGLEFVCKEVQELLSEHGITHERTVVHTPEQNGSTERENRTFFEAASTVLQSSDFPVNFWAEAIKTATYVLNRTSTSSVKGKTPFELWYNKKPNLKDLHIFGQEVYSHIPKIQRKKWDAKAKRGFFIIYEDNTKGYRIWHPDTGKIEIARDVIFEEPSDTNVVVSTDNSYTPPQPYKDRLRDPSLRKQPKRYGSSSLFEEALVAVRYELINYKDAMSCQNEQKWKKAMQDEMDSLKKNQVWELVNPPVNSKIIGCRWVYKIKNDAAGKSMRYKARLVAKGYNQEQGIDYQETFSPVVRYESIRLLLSLAAKESLIINQFDIKTVYLNGQIEEEIYMDQPLGSNDGTTQVCKLQRSLYGLKQSSRCWNDRFTNFLRLNNLKSSVADPCIFTCNDKEKRIVVAIFIDDGLLLTKDRKESTSLLVQLKKEFEVTECTSRLFLGMQIGHQEDGAITFQQTAYATKILDRFRMQDANPVEIPADPHSDFCVDMHTNQEISKAPYHEAVGSLLYLSNGTRPDITIAVNRASRYLENTTKLHCNAVKHIFKYIKGTLEYGLIFKKENTNTLEVYSDADYAGELETRKSTSDWLVKYGQDTIPWNSQRQSTKIVSGSQYTGENQFQTLCGQQKRNMLNKNPIFYKRTKHIDINYHFVCLKYEEMMFELEYINTKDQQADILTKALHYPAFECHRLKICAKV